MKRTVVNLLLGAIMLYTPVHAVAAPLNYLSTTRQVSADNGFGGVVQATTATVGLWSKSVTAPSGNAFGVQNSTLADSVIEARFASGCGTAENAPPSSSSSSSIYAQLRLDEQCVVSLSGTVTKFLDTPTSSFTFSLQGGAFMYFYEAPAEGENGDFTFAQSNLMLDPGIYEFEVRSTVQGGFGGVSFDFLLNAAVVPAPGAGGLASAIALLASRRQRRSTGVAATNE